jgi:hypothetical protein
MVRKRSCPAVSQIWSLIVFPSSSIVRIFYKISTFTKDENRRHVSSNQNKTERTYKVNTDSRNVGFSVCIICESKQQTRLSNTGVSDEEEFEKVVAVVKEKRTDVVVRTVISRKAFWEFSERETRTVPGSCAATSNKLLHRTDFTSKKTLGHLHHHGCIVAYCMSQKSVKYCIR